MKYLIIMIFGIASAAAAQVADVAFEEMDTDQDGYVSFQEAMANPEIVNEFNDADLDADGLLSREEFETANKS